MNLVQVRSQFVELSGRHDLVKDIGTFANNGADFFINAGQKFLDRKSTTQKRENRIFVPLNADDWYLTFQDCRIINNVWINDDSSRARLTKKDFVWLHNKFSSTIAETDSGTPLYYCPAKLRSTEFTSKDSLAAFFNQVVSKSDAYRGIIILPPPSEDTVVEIHGVFYSKELILDTDTSVWTNLYPDLLILASLYQLEILGHRNTQGARDYLGALEVGLLEIEKDVIEEDIQDVEDIDF